MNQKQYEAEKEIAQSAFNKITRALARRGRLKTENVRACALSSIATNLKLIRCLMEAQTFRHENDDVEQIKAKRPTPPPCGKCQLFEPGRLYQCSLRVGPDVERCTSLNDWYAFKAEQFDFTKVNEKRLFFIKYSGKEPNELHVPKRYSNEIEDKMDASCRIINGRPWYMGMKIIYEEEGFYVDWTEQTKMEKLEFKR